MEKSYNFKIYEFFCDEIFLLMLIPGLDAARVTILRVRKKISPLQPDKQHLHHYIERIFSEKITWLICLSLSSLPIILLEIYDKFILSLLFPSMIYALLIFKATQNKAK